MKIVAASCCKLQNINPQPVWKQIMDEKPDALVLLGDNVYIDHDHHSDPDDLKAELKQKYEAQLEEPHFAALLEDLRKRNARLIAIYDDHDFLGNNRYGGDYGTALRDAARDEFVRVFHPQMTGSDVYSAHRLGLVDVYLLDERYYRKSPGLSNDSRDAILGVEQWNWLERTLQVPSQAKYTIIASSTTLHTFADESWEQYPSAFRRMVQMISKRPPGTFILSGDVHRNAAYDDSGVIEIVTSGVARKGIVFGSVRENYAVLTFDPQKLKVDLRSLKAQWRLNFDLALDRWHL